VRRLIAVILAGGALWLAPGAFAAGWCGTGESPTDRADVTTGQQVHALVIAPADGADTFATDANRLAGDVDSMTAWWTGQDPTRAPRFDQAVFPAGTCLDISFLRLADTSTVLRGANNAFERVTRALESAGFGNAYKKYYVYYDGPAVQANICGTGGGDFSSGPAYAIIWLQGCPNVASDAVGTHELVHALGALPAGAPHACPNDPGHPCDGAPSLDVLYPTTDGRPLLQQVLDVNHDDYYAHSGTWNDLQDSLWLRHLDAPQVPLTVAMAGTGSVASDLPGLDCAAPCATQWDQGTLVTLSAVPVAGQRFVHWSGDCVGNGSCAVRLTQPQSAVAVFGPLFVPVRVATAGRGSVSCVPRCSRAFAAGRPLTLRALPAKGWKFVAWAGACTGSRPVCRPATDFALRVRATFRRAPTVKHS
jgi:hypothetical protein